MAKKSSRVGILMQLALNDSDTILDSSLFLDTPEEMREILTEFLQLKEEDDNYAFGSF